MARSVAECHYTQLRCASLLITNGLAMRLHLGGHLAWYAQKKSWVDVPLTQPTRLTDVLKNLGVPIGEIAIGTCNGKPMPSLNDVIVNDADMVELFPPVGGG